MSAASEALCQLGLTICHIAGLQDHSYAAGSLTDALQILAE
jgi:hypothetical protein